MRGGLTLALYKYEDFQYNVGCEFLRRRERVRYGDSREASGVRRSIRSSAPPD